VNGTSASGIAPRCAWRTKGLERQNERWLVPISIGSVAVVLGLGLVNMMRGGDGNASQTFMRWRVILQFIAIVVIMAAIWFKSR
jgi:hypothetical protein